MQSGMILSSDQSPPPMTFPARTVARAFPDARFRCRRRTSCKRRLSAPTSFTGAVRVVAAHGVALAVSPGPFLVLVAFVACDVDDRRDRVLRRQFSSTLTVPPMLVSKVSLGSCIPSLTSAWAARWKTNSGLKSSKTAFKVFEVPHVAPDIGKAVGDTGDDEIVPFCNRREGIPRHLGAQLQEPGVSQDPLKPVWPVTRTLLPR